MKAATRLNQRDVSPLRISIHAAREGGDRNARCRASTLSISIHAAREGGDFASNPTYEDFGISIHAAREGGDVRVFEMLNNVFLFQSTPPVKAATGIENDKIESIIISIHAAREGGDCLGCIINSSNKDFNPRRP